MDIDMDNNLEYLEYLELLGTTLITLYIPSGSNI